MDKHELKSEVDNRGGKFFTRNNMKFAGDTMSNYHVSAKPVTISTWTRENVPCWELRRKKPVKHGLQNSAYFNCETFELMHPKR